MSGAGARTALCLLLLLATACTALINHSRGAVTPKDPYVHIGHDLILTCNLTRRSVYENASSMYFTWGMQDTRVEASHVAILSPTSIQLRKRVTSKKDGGNYVCCLGQGGSKKDIIGHMMVTVDYEPVPVQNVSCVVDNWDSMNCSWTLGQRYINPTHINVSLIWVISSQQQPCPEMNTTWCVWRKDDYMPEAFYLMVIIVKNLKTGKEAATEKFTINSGNLVKPRPVEGLRTRFSNSTCLQLAWNSSNQYRQFVYNVTYQAIHPGEDSPAEAGRYECLETEATLCDLSPFTPYRLRVAALPIPTSNRGSKKPAGFLSDWVSVEGRTEESVPSRAPPMDAGGFVQMSFSDAEPSFRLVTLYWKPVERQYLRGTLTGFLLRYMQADTGEQKWTETNVSKELNMYTDLKLRKDQSYHVSLFARTSVGLSLANSSLFIPRWTGDALYPRNVTVEVELGNVTRYHVHWRPPAEGRALSYSVFWCKGDRVQGCLDSISWMPMDASQLQAEVDVNSRVDSIDTYLLGVSAEMETSGVERTFSGIVWSKCNYVSGKAPSAVPNVLVSSNEPDGGLRVEWSEADCSASRGLVTQYEVAYCPVIGRAECSEPYVKVNRSSLETPYVILGAKAGKRYRVTVTPLSKAGRGPVVIKFHLYKQGSDESFNSVIGLIIGVLFAGIFIILGVFLVLRKLYEIKRKPLSIEHPHIKEEAKGPTTDPTYEKIPILVKASRRDGRDRSVDSETALLDSEEAVDRRSSTSGRGGKAGRAVPGPIRQASRHSSGDNYFQQNGNAADQPASNPQSTSPPPDTHPERQGSPGIGSGYQPHDPQPGSQPHRNTEVMLMQEMRMIPGYVPDSRFHSKGSTTTPPFLRQDSASARGYTDAAPACRRDQSSSLTASDNIPLQHNATSPHGRQSGIPVMGYVKATSQSRQQEGLYPMSNARAAPQSRQQEGLYSISNYTAATPDERHEHIPSTGNARASIPYRELNSIPSTGNAGASIPYRGHGIIPFVGHAMGQETSSKPLLTAPYSRQAALGPPASTPLLQEEPQDEDEPPAEPNSGFQSLDTTTFGNAFIQGQRVPTEVLLDEESPFHDPRLRSHGYVAESSLSSFFPRQ